MRSLKSVLDSLRETLPTADELDPDDPSQVCWEVDEAIGIAGRNIAFLEGIEDLSPEDKQLFDALAYFQSVVHVYGETSSDGFLSIFYNDDGRELELTRRLLSEARAPIAPLFERALTLLRPLFEISDDTNWVTRNLDADPHEVVGKANMAEIEEIESEVDRLINESYSQIYSRYREARA